MSRLTRAVLLTAAVAMLWPAAAWAQYPSEIAGFNGPPFDNYSDQEMFNRPENSGSTSMYIQINDPNHLNYDEAYRSSESLLNPVDAACLKVYFYWLDPLDTTNSWVRLNTNAGALRPNPSLNTQGKVRFQITNEGDDSFRGPFGICLGIRETGTIVPQMKDGGAIGCIEWVGVSNVKTGITTGPDHIVNTTATGGDAQVYPVGFNLASDPNLPYDTAVIVPAAGQTLKTTVLGGDDLFRRGYIVDDNGARRPIPAVTLDPSGFAYQLEFDLATGHVTVDGSPQNPSDLGGFAPFAGTANGILDPNNNRGTLEHIAITNANPADPDLAATKFAFGIDQMQFESPVPDPTIPPRVAAPIVQGTGVSVTVTDLLYAVNRVELYKNGSFSQGIDVGDNTDVVFTETCVTGDRYSARQRNGQNNTWSSLSVEITVLSGPPPYSFSLMVDENGGGSCVATGWEWVGVTSVAGYVPQGYNLIVPNDAVWQTIDIPLNNPALVRATAFGGNGTLGPSSTGFYTMDSVWFSLPTTLDPADPNNLGPFEVLMDGVQYVDPNGVATTIINEETVDQFYFARGQSPQQTLTYGRTTAGSYDGVQSHRTSWSFTSTATSLGQLQRAAVCGTQPLIPSTATAIRFHMVARGKPTAPGVALPTIMGPIVGAQTGVRVNLDPNAAVPSSVQLYVNGAAVGSPGVPDPNHLTYMDFSPVTLALGDSVSATQVIGGVTSDYAYPRASSAPTPPAVASPLYPTGTVVTVNSITNVPFARASQVNVIVRNANGTIAQNVPKVLDPNGVASTTVTVTALVAFQTVTATQTVNSTLSQESAAVTVAVPAPTIFAAPSSAATVIKLQDCDATATDASIFVYSQSPADPNLPVESDPNATVVAQIHGTFDPANHAIAYVNVAGLLTAGQVVTARQTAAGVESANSFWDPVTGTTITNFAPPGVGPPAPDTMEGYTGQMTGAIPFENPTYPTLMAADHGWWGTGNNPTLRWTGDPNFLLTYPGKGKNSTPGGGYSGYVPATCSPQVSGTDTNCGANTDGWRCNFDTSYADPNWALLMDMTSTPTEPLVFSIAIYDVGGAGVDGLRHFASVASYTGATLNVLCSVGMPGTFYFAAVNNNYYSARLVNAGGAGYFDLNWPGAPQRSIGWHTITTVLKRTRADFYVDGVLAKKNMTFRFPFYNNLYMGSGVPGWEAWYDDFYFWKGPVGFVARLPNFPTVASPIQDGDTSVSLARIEAGVTSVTVYANDLAHPIGTASVSGQTTLTVPVTALHKGDRIRATATDANGTSELGVGLEVGGGNGALLVCIGVRETNETTALGGIGGGSGPIEWIGASGTFAAIPPAVAAPVGTKVLTVQDGWQTLTFDSTVDPMLSFSAGNGMIDPNKPNNAVLEHIAVTVDPNNPLKSSGPFTLYVDDVVNVGAGAGGADVVIASFEEATAPAQIMLVNPSFSGSSSSNLSTPPDSSASSTDYALTGTQSEKLSWFFKDTTAGRWIRLTTSGAAYKSRPVINPRLPIRISFKLSAPGLTGACCTNYVCTVVSQTACLAGGGKFKGVGTACSAGICACRGDASGDGLISFADINPFVQALGNLAGWQAAHPTVPWQNCDVNADGVVSFADINPFVAKLGSPGACP